MFILFCQKLRLLEEFPQAIRRDGDEDDDENVVAVVADADPVVDADCFDPKAKSDKDAVRAIDSDDVDLAGVLKDCLLVQGIWETLDLRYISFCWRCSRKKFSCLICLGAAALLSCLSR